MSLASTLQKRICPHHKVLTVAAYVAALIVVCIFPSFDRRTEIEEHALIPGYAGIGFDEAWAQKLHAAIRRIENSPSIAVALDDALVNAELVSYHMNFTTPGGLPSSLAYTVIPSSRGDSREAVVLVVATNWTSSARGTQRAAWGMAVGVVLSQYLKTVHWLSKDIFVIFVDSTLPYGAGVRAWLKAYFGGASAVRRGALRQAIVLSTVSKPSSLLCDVEGINGMVPNQDVVNAYMISARNRKSLPVFHRESWESVAQHFANGGVHSSHAPFLEVQVPSFTVLGQRSSARSTVRPEAIAQSLEGVLRSLSNNLQQLHHSFNFYFFTGSAKHISSGIYLYPVFAMQLPLISFLLTSPTYRDIRSLLVGLGTTVGVAAVAGGPVFLLASDVGLASWLGALDMAAPPACVHPDTTVAGTERRRLAAATWLSSSAAACIALALPLRSFAFRAFTEASRGGAGALQGEPPPPPPQQLVAEQHGVRLPAPLWEAVCTAAGFAFLAMLVPITIYSWSVALPLTVVCVPILILVRPFSARKLPLRSLFLLSFLATNLFLLIVPPATRSSLLGPTPGLLAAGLPDLYDQATRGLPREVVGYLPTALVTWLRAGHLGAILQRDMLVELFERARDFNCVGGMLFPVFCFVYWPLLVLLGLVGLVLPAQRVDDQGISWQQARLGLLLVLSLVLSGLIGGVYWRSLSSAGLGKLQW